MAERRWRALAGSWLPAPATRWLPGLGPGLALALAVGLAAGLSTQLAHAHDDEVPIGAQAAMTGAAVTATVDDGSASFYNPAGLAHADRFQLDARVQVLGLRFKRPERLLIGPEGQSTTRTFFDWVFTPTSLSFIRPLTDRVNLAVGGFVSRRSDEFIDAELGLGSERWQLSARRRETNILYTAGVGWHPTAALRLGLSLGMHYAFRLNTVSVFGGRPDAGDAAYDYTSFSGVSDYGAAATLGAQYDLSSQLTVGTSVRLPTLSVVRLRRLNSSEVQSFPSIEGGSSSEQDFTDKLVGSQGIVWPARVRAGVVYRPSNGSWLALDGDVMTPLERELFPDRVLRWNLRLGGKVQVSEIVHLGAGLFTDRDPRRGGNMHFYGLTLGAELMRHFTSRGGRLLSLGNVLSVRYAYGAGDDRAFRVPELRPGASLETLESFTPIHDLTFHLGTTLYL